MATIFAKLGMGGWPSEQLGDRLAEGIYVFGRAETDGKFVCENFRDAAGATGDDGGSTSHGLNHDFTEGFGPEARDYGELASAIELTGVGEMPEEMHDVVDAKVNGELLKFGLVAGAIEEGFTSKEKMKPGKLVANLGDRG